MRLAIGRAARHGRADARRDLRVEKIDVEADMQDAVARLDPFDDPPDQDADTELIDRAHVRHCDAAIADQILLKRIDRADSEQIELIGTDREPRPITQQAIEAGLAAEERRRPPLHVAGHGRRRRIVVGVGVEPQHENRTAQSLPVSRDAVYRSHRQAVIAPPEDRNGAPAGEQKGAFAERAYPTLDVIIIFRGVWRRTFGDRCGLYRKIAVILDTKSQLLEYAADARRPHGVRRQQGAPSRRPDLDGNPEQGDLRRAGAFRYAGHGRCDFQGWNGGN